MQDVRGLQDERRVLADWETIEDEQMDGLFGGNTLFDREYFYQGIPKSCLDED